MKRQPDRRQENKGKTDAHESTPAAQPPPRRQLIGFFSADASSEAIAKAIIAARPKEKRPVDDPARIAWERAQKDDDTKKS